MLADPVYPRTVINTLIYLAIGVNLKLFLALLLSGFFMRKGWWVKALLLIYILPWAVPAIPTFISIHWMLNAQWGLINNAHLGAVPDRRPALARYAGDGDGLGDLRLYLEMDAVLDGDLPRRADGDPARAV